MPTEAERDHYLLDRWISGRLTAPEEAELERRAAADPELGEALAALQAAPGADHLSRITAMRERARPRAVSRRIPYARLALAATVLLLLSATVLVLTEYLGTPDTPLVTYQAPEAEPAVTAPRPPAPAPASAPSGSESNSPAADPVPPAQAKQAEGYAPAPALLRAAAAPPPTLTGRVLDRAARPLPATEVRQAGADTGVTTDRAGNFALPIDPALDRLMLRYPGGAADTLTVTGPTARLQIQLEEAFAPDTVPTAPAYLARPAEGIAALRRRLESNAPAGVSPGTVAVSFLVGTDGRLSDFRFRGQPDGATVNYVKATLVETSSWRVVSGQLPVRVYFTLRLE